MPWERGIKYQYYILCSNPSISCHSSINYILCTMLIRFWMGPCQSECVPCTWGQIAPSGYRRNCIQAFFLLEKPNLILTALPRGKTPPMQMALIWSNVGANTIVGTAEKQTEQNAKSVESLKPGWVLICRAGAVQLREMSRWGPGGLRVFPQATVLLLSPSLPLSFSFGQMFISSDKSSCSHSALDFEHVCQYIVLRFYTNIYSDALMHQEFHTFPSDGNFFLYMKNIVAAPGSSVPTPGSWVCEWVNLDHDRDQD